MPLTAHQRATISEIVADLQALLAEDAPVSSAGQGSAGPGPASILRTATPTGSPEWYAENKRCWRFLAAVAALPGAAPPSEISRLALECGYDPRAVNGFYRGNGCLRRAGAHDQLREITETGRAWLADNEPFFGPDA